MRRIRALPKPVIVAVNGVAAGAGANLALNGDIVLAARSAKFIEPFCKLGLVPDAGGTWLLPRLIGEARAKAVAMLGDPIAAEQAESWGLIWKAVDDDKLQAEAMRLATRLAEGPTQGFAAQKAGDPRRRPQQPRPATRPGARPAARTRLYAGLSGGRRGLPRKAQPHFTGE